VTSAPSVASSSPRLPHKKIPGEPCVWIFILGDMMVFAVFFAAFLVERSKQVDQFDASQATLNSSFAAFNTLVLLVSSFCMVLAMNTIRMGQRDSSQRLILGAFACGALFIVVRVFEYHERIAAGEVPSTNSFYMFYFVLTGLHLFHLVIGLAVLTVLFFLTRKAILSTNQVGFFEGGACFWHMVDLLWLVLFPLIFLVR